MNTLSWLLYAAEVLGNVQNVSVVAATVTGIAAVTCLGAAGMVISSYPDDNDRANHAWLLSKVKPLVIACFCAGLLAALLPSKNTIMLIAASEVGETILTSEKAQEIGGEAGALATDSLRVLRKFINEQLVEEKAE